MNIEELKRLAEDALWTGRWYDGGCETLMGTYGDDSEACEGHGEIAHPVPLEIVPYLVEVQPAAILELIAEMERLREDADDLTIALESSEKALKDSRANDYTAMGYLADCRIAVGDNGKRMLPEFVGHLQQLKQQRDELLAALRDVVGWVPGREKWHTNAPIEAVERARAAIAKVEG